MDLDKKIGIKENLIAEVGEQEAEMIWDRAKRKNGHLLIRKGMIVKI